MASSSFAAAVGTSGTPLNPSNLKKSTPNFCTSLPLIPASFNQTILRTDTPISSIHRSSPNFSPATFSQPEPETEELDSGSRPAPYSAAPMVILPPVRRQRRAYRNQYPGEEKGIAEETRFVAMGLRNNGSPKSKRRAKSGIDSEDCDEEEEVIEANDSSGIGEYWQPSMEGFLRYLVDSRLVFSIIERTVDETSDVSYAYFRNTGLERADCISRDLEWLSEQGNDFPEPSNPGVDYSNYLEELGEKNPPLFLCHFYNIYFSHIAGGQVIAKKVCEKLIRGGGEGRALEMYRWNGNEEKLLQGVREKLNMLSQHWPRNHKNRCLQDMRKSFRFLDKIVPLIVL